MQNNLIFFVNGVKVTESSPDPRANLLNYLRRTLRLTGSKEGCGEGRCGACTVMLSRYDSGEKTIRHMAVNACLLPLCSLHNMAVTTVEGVGDTRRGLHKIQECLAEAHGVQCGFCTSGMVMSMYTLLRNIPRPSQEDIQLAIEDSLWAFWIGVGVSGGVLTNVMCKETWQIWAWVCNDTGQENYDCTERGEDETP